MDGQSQGGHIVLVTDSYNNSSVISWSSNKVRRVVCSTLAAETLSFADGAESAIYFSNIIQEFFPVTHKINIICYTDSRSLFEAAGSSSNVSDRRLRVEVSAIREMIQKGEVSMKWIEGKHQVSDVLTKKGASPFILMETLQSGNCSC